MKNTSLAYRIGRRTLVVIFVLNGVGALYGGVAAFIAPDFMGAELLVPIFHNLPLIGPYLNSLILPASALLLFICLPQSLAAILLLRRHTRQYIVAALNGAMLVAFTFVEILIIPNPLSLAYLLVGVVQMVLGIVLQRQPDGLH